MNKLNFLPLLLLFGQIILSVAGYTQSSTDSLWNIWQDNSKSDSLRFEALNTYIWENYLFRQPDSAVVLAQIQYDKAQEKGLKEQMATALNTSGVAYGVIGNCSEALDYFKRSLKINEEIKYKKGIARSLNNLGNTYTCLNDNDKALEYFLKCLKVRIVLRDEKGVASVLSNIGIIYKAQGNNAQAIDYFMKSLKMSEKVGNEKSTAAVLSNIGGIYSNQKEYAKALDFYNRSLKMREKTDDKRGMGIVYNNIGVNYYNEGDIAYSRTGNIQFATEKYMKALNNYTKSLSLYEETGNKAGIAGIYTYIGIIHFDLGQFAMKTGNKDLVETKNSLALDYLTKSLRLQEELGNKAGVAAALNTIGKICIGKEDYTKAIFYCTRALRIAQEIDSDIEVKRASHHLWESYKKTSQFEKALQMHELFSETMDSINSEANRNEVIRQEYKYEYEKQAAQDSIRNIEEEKVRDAEFAQQRAEIKAKNNQQLMLYGGMGLMLVFAGFMYNRFRITQKQKNIIEDQKDIVEEKNKEIMDSITYAKRIQSAILPPLKIVKEHLPESFILYKPKDIVAGDFYWFEQKNGKILIAAADCTGHGVPGALVSVICNHGLNRSTREYNLTEPGKILDKTREIVISEFEKSEENVKDGMDISLVSLAYSVRLESDNEVKNTIHLQWAGANNPLWIIRKGVFDEKNTGTNFATEIKTEVIDNHTFIEVKPNKQPISKFDNPQPFTTHEINLQSGDTFYIFSDGFADQFGGPKGKKFKYKKLKDLLLSIQDRGPEEQKKVLENAFENWRTDLEQVDDVCVIGVRI